MRQVILITVLLFIGTPLAGQTVEETYPGTLWCPNDTFFLKFSNFPGLYPHQVSTLRGSDGGGPEPGSYMTIYYGKDSIHLPYHNHIPYAQIFHVNMESPLGKTTARFHYNEMTGYFSKEYIDKYTGKAQFDVPEVYELANVIWTLSGSGQRAGDLYKEGDYYQAVLKHFKPYLRHPVFNALDLPDSIADKKYLDFRENSFCFHFKDQTPGSANCELLYDGPYYWVFGNDLADSSLFGKLKSRIEDFAARSGFRQFYKNNMALYAKQIEREKQLMPVVQMWAWLEKEFPQTKYDAYRIVFSPLIKGTHSTQNYSQSVGYPKRFKEAVMFVCGPDIQDAYKGQTEKQKEGLMSGIVFTEIDHNYNNPVSRTYAKQIDSVFSKRLVWAKKGNSSGFYQRPLSVFDEYMTHAIFCLYILETYDGATAELVVNSREKMMAERRNFIRFKEFDQELIRLRKLYKNKKVCELYPFILAWCKLQS